MYYQDLAPPARGLRNGSQSSEPQSLEPSLDPVGNEKSIRKMKKPETSEPSQASKDLGESGILGNPLRLFQKSWRRSVRGLEPPMMAGRVNRARRRGGRSSATPVLLLAQLFRSVLISREVRLPVKGLRVALSQTLEKGCLTRTTGGAGRPCTPAASDSRRPNGAESPP